jgi:hypothetical protein
MMKPVLLQHWEGLSDRQALERMTFDLRWKAVLGMEVGEAAVAQSTLAKFRARLQLHQQMEKAFGRFLKRVVELGRVAELLAEGNRSLHGKGGGQSLLLERVTSTTGATPVRLSRSRWPRVHRPPPVR